MRRGRADLLGGRDSTDRCGRTSNVQLPYS